VSSPFRGTQLVYSLGESTDAAPSVRPWSFGTVLAQTAHLIAFLSPVLPRTLDLHAESRSLSFMESSWTNLLKQLWKSDWAQSRDATPYDVTFEAADERESIGEGKVNPNTFYRSHVACTTQQISDSDRRHAPSLLQITSPVMYFTARAVGMFDYSTLQPPPSFIPAAVIPSASTNDHDAERCVIRADPAVVQRNLGEEYWANDGVVPIFSQWHPQPCRSTNCIHLSQCKPMPTTPKPGIWYVRQIDDATHVSLLPIWMSSKRQRVFWGELGDWLETIDRLNTDTSDDTIEPFSSNHGDYELL